MSRWRWLLVSVSSPTRALIATFSFTPQVDSANSYDIFAINIASTMLGYLYGGKGSGASRSLTSNQSLGVKVATPVGNIFGQFFFGWMADVVGRKRMCKCRFNSQKFRNSQTQRWYRAHGHHHCYLWPGCCWPGQGNQHPRHNHRMEIHREYCNSDP